MKNKFKVKSLNSGTLSKALTAGVLACVLSCGAVMPVMAASYLRDDTNIDKTTYRNIVQSLGYEVTESSPDWSYDASFEGKVIDYSSNLHQHEPDSSYLEFRTDFATGKTVAYFSFSVYEGGQWLEYQDDDYSHTDYFNKVVRKTVTLSESQLNALGIKANVGGTTYTAGTGITISSDNKVYV